VGFLRVVMGPNGIKIVKVKVRGVLEWPAPRCIKDVQKFLGLANYYQRLVKDFSEIVRPMHKLVQKGKKWNWGSEQEKALKGAKGVLDCD